jgi:nucleoside-diphosphate-sugar epimerase
VVGLTHAELDLTVQAEVDTYFKIEKPEYVFLAAAKVGGIYANNTYPAEFIFSNLEIQNNVIHACYKFQVKKLLFLGSACIYPKFNQEDPENPNCAEDSAYPAFPDSEYGWEKLFSERLYLAFHRNYGIEVRIARFHNVFGPEGSWNDGREKAPAALCRKVAMAEDGGEIEIWGDGKQTRSFLYIDECLEGVLRLMHSEWTGPVNIGSEEMVAINQLAEMIMEVAGKKLKIKNIPGPLGVRGRNSDNRLIEQKLGWRHNQPLIEGLKKTYPWIEEQVRKAGLKEKG